MHYKEDVNLIFQPVVEKKIIYKDESKSPEG